jgi:hypothetical protein
MAVALFALLRAANGAAFAAGSFTASDGTITACRDNKSGVLRVINAQGGQACSAKETTITWKDGITGKLAGVDKLDGIDSSGFAAFKRTVVVSPCHVAISNDSASPRLTYLTAQSTGKGNSITIAVFNSSSSPTMIDVTSTASGGSNANHGVFDSNASSIIRHSKLMSGIGAGSALTHVGGTSKIENKPLGTGATLQCFNNYNETMAAVSCP